MRKRFSLAWLLFVSISISAGKLEKGFDALKVHDYFKAKGFFEASMKKQPAGASFGLCLIYSQNNNPFYNLDSAYKYVQLADSLFPVLGEKEKKKLIELGITKRAINEKHQEVIEKAFEQYHAQNTIEAYNKYILYYHTAEGKKKMAIEYRNRLAYRMATEKNTADAYLCFMQTYPQAKQFKEASDKYQLLLFKENTKNNDLKSYETFIKKYPQSPYVPEAENAIYSITTKTGTIKAYHEFIKKYPENHRVEEAWKNIYTLYTSDFRPESIADFHLEFPDYPYLENVKRDIHLAKMPYLPVKNNKGKWGFIDTTGTLVIPYNFDWCEPFSEGLASVGLNDKGGYIDKTGKVVIDIKYDEVEPFKNGFAVVAVNDKYGLIRKTGREAIALAYDEVFDVSEGFVVAVKDSMCTYLDEQGKLLLNKQYKTCGDFKEGMAFVRSADDFGFIDNKGNMMIEPEFEWVENFSMGLARVQKNSKYGLINSKGDTILSCRFDQVDEFKDDIALVVKDGKFGFVSKQGAIIVPEIYDYSHSIRLMPGFYKGFARIESKGKQGLIDTKGNFILPLKNFEEVGYASEFIIPVRKKKLWGFIDMQQKTVIPFAFDHASHFENGCAPVMKNLKYALIDKLGKNITAYDYDMIHLLTDSCWVVQRNGLNGLIDKSGKELIPCIVEAIESAPGIENINSGILKVQRNQKTAFYSTRSRRFIWKEEGFD